MHDRVATVMLAATARQQHPPEQKPGAEETRRALCWRAASNGAGTCQVHVAAPCRTVATTGRLMNALEHVRVSGHCERLTQSCRQRPHHCRRGRDATSRGVATAISNSCSIM
jgi:hypothetical protein